MPCGDELLATEYSYLTSENRLTNIVESVTHKVNGYTDSTIKYSYDANGNITAIRTRMNANSAADAMSLLSMFMMDSTA